MLSNPLPPRVKDIVDAQGACLSTFSPLGAKGAADGLSLH